MMPFSNSNCVTGATQLPHNSGRMCRRSFAVNGVGGNGKPLTFFVRSIGSMYPTTWPDECAT